MVIPLDQRPRSGPYSGMSARSAQRFLAQAFLEAKIPFAEEDALEIILAATALDKTGLMLRGQEVLEPDVFDLIFAHMDRRLAGEPVDHILGWREFYGRRFFVSKDVLSPRADTENLIRGALRRAEKNEGLEILDMGTGSGAIGLTVLAECETAALTATDVSSAALKVAKKNAAVLNLQDRVEFRKGNWWAAVPDGRVFDIILSNPPYITDAAMDALEREVLNYDPDLALRGGVDGLRAYHEIISGAPEYLKSDGWLGLEIGFDQGESVRSLLRNRNWKHLTLDVDLGGQDRVVWAQKRG